MPNNDVVMSASMLPAENIWNPVSIWDPVSISEGISTDSSNPAQSIASGSIVSSSMRSRGRLEIPSAGVSSSEQELEISFIGEGYIIENLPVNSWPEISIEPETRSLRLLPSDKTVEGGVLFTRVAISLVKAGPGFLYVYGIDQPLELDVRPLSELEMQKLLYRAKLLRKLKYIERVFNVKFSLPDEMSSEDVKLVETVFRGITEGAFSTRAPQATFRISPQDVDLNTPPYFGPGQFDASIGQEINLLGQQLKAGPVTVHIDKAELGNPRAVEQIQKGSLEPVVVRFEILDNQISFRFEDYIKQTKEYLLESLERFKQELALEEPKELVDLISDPLAKDVSSFEAVQIAVGWQFYNRLPDRYCPQEPILDEAKGCWRVPIYLVYTSGEGGPVGELVIDLKTGKILDHTPVEELRSRGLALAKKLLHAG